MKYRVSLIGLILCVGLVLAACIPAKTPVQLEHTPGAFIRINDKMIYADTFEVQYPGGWRVVKNSIAAAPLSFVFVSPDDTMTISVQEGDLTDTTFDDELQTQIEAITLENGTIITVIGRAPQEAWPEFSEIYEWVRRSVRASK